jgi:diguanylate cyclase (GGDEF)-like protein
VFRSRAQRSLVAHGADRGADPLSDQRPPANTTAAYVLALLYTAGGLACFCVSAGHASARAPIGLALAFGSIDLVIGACLLVGRHRAGAAVLHAGVVVRLVFASALVASAPMATGVALNGVTYFAVVVFSTCFFCRPVARCYAALAVLGISAGTLASDAAGLMLVWGVLVTALVCAVEVLGHVFAQLQRQANRDDLTGLLNRAGFRLAAERAIARCSATRAPLTLMMLDLDAFKEVNDTYGHLAGDTLLAELAHAWQGQLSATDVLARYGGDEFALLLTGPDAAAALHVLDRLRGSHPTRWSVGVASWAPGGRLDELLERADHELYRAKSKRVPSPRSPSHQAPDCASARSGAA